MIPPTSQSLWIKHASGCYHCNIHDDTIILMQEALNLQETESSENTLTNSSSENWSLASGLDAERTRPQAQTLIQDTQNTNSAEA